MIIVDYSNQYSWETVNNSSALALNKFRRVKQRFIILYVIDNTCNCNIRIRSSDIYLSYVLYCFPAAGFGFMLQLLMNTLQDVSQICWFIIDSSVYNTFNSVITFFVDFNFLKRSQSNLLSIGSTGGGGIREKNFSFTSFVLLSDNVTWTIWYKIDRKLFLLQTDQNLAQRSALQ